MSDRLTQDLKKVIIEETAPLREGMAKVADQLQAQSKRMNEIADEFRNSAQKFVRSQEGAYEILGNANERLGNVEAALGTTNTRLENVETALGTANTRLEHVEVALGELHEIRLNTQNMAAAINALVERLTPK
jgi:archaellum component FlaC